MKYAIWYDKERQFYHGMVRKKYFFGLFGYWDEITSAFEERDVIRALRVHAADRVTATLKRLN